MLGTDKEPGIYVRTLNDLFRAIEETSDDMLYSVSMSYLEVSHGSHDTLSTLLSYCVVMAADEGAQRLQPSSLVLLE